MNTSRPGLLAIAALAGAMAWGAACLTAQAEAPTALRSEMKSALFRFMDTNGDGIITKLEYDARSNGFVKELAGRDPDLARRFLALTPDEQRARLDLRFTSLDADGDGRIDDREWISAQPAPLLPG